MDTAYFDQRSTEWDTPRRKERAQVIAQKIAAKLDPQKDKKAMEFGCGTGLIAFSLLDKIPQIACCDPSESMIEIVQEKIIESGTKQLTIIPYDSLDEDCYFGRFDLIYSSMVFHHISDIDAELFQLRHLLIKGGRLITVDLDPCDPDFHAEDKDFQGHSGFSHDEFTKIMKRGGFEQISFEDCYSDIKQVGGKSIPYSLFLCTATK